MQLVAGQDGRPQYFGHHKKALRMEYILSDVEGLLKAVICLLLTFNLLSAM